MAKSERQISLKKKKVLFTIISHAMWIGTAIVLACLALSNLKATEEGVQIFTDEFQSKIVSVSITILIGIIVAIIIKEKVRVFTYMASLVLATILYKEVGMYIVLGIWLVDEYVIHVLAQKYTRLYEIRKEIDQG